MGIKKGFPFGNPFGIFTLLTIVSDVCKSCYYLPRAAFTTAVTSAMFTTPSRLTSPLRPGVLRVIVFVTFGESAWSVLEVYAVILSEGVSQFLVPIPVDESVVTPELLVPPYSTE